ncbi:hypothetical protein FRB99_006770 [Tulasnella sp. 403]|nr:hypothetical protein FRB99_006770 [Tulasnella sp. 403]
MAATTPSMSPAMTNVLNLAVNMIFECIEKESTAKDVCSQQGMSDTENEFQQIDKAVAILGDVSKCLPRSIEEKAIALRKRRNAMLTIHRIPIEIFTYILEVSVQTHENDWHHSDSYSDYLCRLQQLARVSTFWLRTVLDTPKLWTVVFMGDSTEAVKLLLDKSGRSPLTLQYPGKASEGLKIMEMVCAQAARWQSVQLRELAIEEVAYLYTATTLPLPLLEEICVVAYRPNESGHLNFNAPRLRSLDLRGRLRLHPNLTVLPNLETLILVSLLEVPADRLFECLIQSPQLHKLELVNLIVTKVDSLPSLDALKLQKWPVRFSNLILLALVQLPAELSIGILHSVTVNHVRNLKVIKDKETVDTEFIKALFLDMNTATGCPLFSDLFGDPSLADITFNVKSDVLQIAGIRPGRKLDNTNVRLKLMGFSTWNEYIWPPFAAITTPLTFDIRGNTGISRDNNVGRKILEKSTQLRIFVDDMDIDDVQRCISAVLGPRSPQERELCPSLQKVLFASKDDGFTLPDAILHLFQAYGNQQDAYPGGVSQPRRVEWEVVLCK